MLVDWWCMCKFSGTIHLVFLCLLYLGLFGLWRRLWLYFRCFSVGKDETCYVVCLVYSLAREEHKNFDGVEWPDHVIKQILLRSMYEWMTTLDSITSSFFLEFIDLLNLIVRLFLWFFLFGKDSIFWKTFFFLGKTDSLSYVLLWSWKWAGKHFLLFGSHIK